MGISKDWTQFAEISKFIRDPNNPSVKYSASQTPQPNTIPVAGNDGKLHINWIPNIQQGFANTIDTIAYYNQNGQEYFLQVGEVAKVSFSNTTTVPLRIATQSDTAYMMWLLPSNTGGTSGGAGAVFLNPNNTTYSNAFGYAQVFRVSSGLYSDYVTLSSFRVGYEFTLLFCVIRNLTVYKSIVGLYNTYGSGGSGPGIASFSTDWRDTTTPWTSLGTIVFPQNSSGYVLVQRIL